MSAKIILSHIKFCYLPLLVVRVLIRITIHQMEKTLEEHGWTLKDLEAAMLEPWSPLKDANDKSINHENITNKENVDKNLVSLSNQMSKISLNAKLTDSSYKYNYENISNKVNVDKKLNSLSNQTNKISFNAKLTDSKEHFISNVSEILNQPLINGWSLFDHQREAILDALKLERLILAYDMGLGKTCIGLIWAYHLSKVYDNCLTIIVCPCTLTENWAREACALGFSIINKTKGQSNPIDNKPQILICSWAKIIDPNSIHSFYTKKLLNYFIIYDEAHAMQNLKSIRTQAALKLALNPLCRGAILSTGTPMKNGRPSNILPLLMAIKHPVTRNIREFEIRYCDAKKTKFCAWDTSGAINLEELKQKIGPYLLRKTKEQCLDLPALDRQEIILPLSVEILEEYDQIVKDIKATHKQRYVNSNSFANPKALEMLHRLRQFTSISKTYTSAQFVVNKVKNTRKSNSIVVFVWFRETANELKNQIDQMSQTESEEFEIETMSNMSKVESFHCEILSGECSAEKRQNLVDAFQKGLIKVLICTFGVGSTGITLTKSNTVILLDRPWTPGDVLQAEDRVRRIGQTADKVESFWMSGFPLDKKLDKLLLDKLKSSEVVLSDQTDDFENESAKKSPSDLKWFKESSFLLKELLETTSHSGTYSNSNVKNNSNDNDIRKFFR